MRHTTTVLLLGVVCAASGLATTPAPYAGHCAVLDRIATAAANAVTRAVGIDTLEKVALGAAESVGPDADGALGLGAGILERKGFSDPPARACALRSIGRTGLDEAVDFLTKLTEADFRQDPSQGLWPAAQVALRDAQLRRLVDPYIKIEFLEGILTGGPDGRGSVAAWAVNELCDRGSQVSLPVISKSLRSRRNGERDEDEIEFCEARMRVVASNPDRVKALASVLTVGGDAANGRLAGWAVNELNSMQTQPAEAELDRFAREIGELPEGSPTRARLGAYRQEILDFQAQRAK